MMQTDAPMTQKGALRSITPCEFLHAFFMQIADDIESGQPEDTLRLWRTAILTMPMCFELFEGEADLWSRARELRDSIAASHETVSYTAVQRIWSVQEFRKRKEKASAARFAARKTIAICAARESSSATSSSPACASWLLCAVRWRMRKF